MPHVSSQYQEPVTGREVRISSDRSTALRSMAGSSK